MGGKLSRAEEQELIGGCQKGDRACWQRLFVLYRQDAWRILYKMMGPASDLEDLVQKVFLKVYRSLDKFEGRSRFSTWLYRICVHVAMDHHRQQKRRHEVLDSDMADRQIDPRADPGADLQHRRLASELHQALAKLKEDKRNVIVLHDLMEVSTAEIGEMMSIPPATVRTRLFYGRKELARHLSRLRTGGRK